jgi:SAM-dependent methyltransferase
MEPHVYKQIFDAECIHWWFKVRRRIIERVLSRHLVAPLPAALDIGSGTGLNAMLIKKFASEVRGLEKSPEAIILSKVRYPELEVTQASFPEADLDRQYNLITLFDVLEHLSDDYRALANIKRHLSSGGKVVITVPAFQWLWSEHDNILHHFRRYTKSSLVKVIKQVDGFEIEYISYFNTTLFLPIVIFRFLRNILGFNRNKTDDFLVPKVLNRLLEKLFAFDLKLINKSLCPFGISIIAVLRKAESSGSES